MQTLYVSKIDFFFFFFLVTQATNSCEFCGGGRRREDETLGKGLEGLLTALSLNSCLIVLLVKPASAWCERRAGHFQCHFKLSHPGSSLACTGIAVGPAGGRADI